MLVVYRAVWTEYESGWGSSPDGVSYCCDKDKLIAFIKEMEAMGNYDCFVRANEFGMVVVNEELMKKINECKNKIYTTVKHPDEGELGIFVPKNSSSQKQLEEQTAKCVATYADVKS